MELEVLELRTVPDHPEQHFKVHFSGLTIKVFSKNIKNARWYNLKFPGITRDTRSNRWYFLVRPGRVWPWSFSGGAMTEKMGGL